MARVTAPPRGAGTRPGFRWWLLQRLTGAALLLFLAAHLIYLHYALDWPITFKDIADSRFLRVVDIGILVLAVYHALYGVRTALLNFGIRGRARGAMPPVLVAGGVIAVVLGLLVFRLLARG